jgi:hypothetical protein
VDNSGEPEQSSDLAADRRVESAEVSPNTDDAVGIVASGTKLESDVAACSTHVLPSSHTRRTTPPSFVHVAVASAGPPFDEKSKWMRVIFGPSQKPVAENHDKPSSEPISVRLCEASETYCGNARAGTRMR